MYQNHFGLHQEPFSIAPDPSFLFLSDAHNEALAHLLYGFSHGGFVLISGEVGTGKTTLLRNLLDRTPADVDVAFILNPRLTVRELLETLCEELGVDLQGRQVDSVKHYIDALNRHLLNTHAQNRSTVVVIDEAQNLTPAVLEQIRLLTNLETHEKKLLRIILLGQPELVDMLDRTELRQLSQRITARYHLTPLNKVDTGNYVSHRLVKAGGNPNIFTKGAVATLYRISAGTPRLINIIADRAMLGAYVAGEYRVTGKIVKHAAKEVMGNSARGRRNWLWPLGAAVALILIIAAGWLLYGSHRPEVPSVASATPALTPQQAQQTTSSSESAPAPVAPPVQATQDTTTQNVADPNPVTREVPNIERPAASVFQLQRAAFQAVFARWRANYSPDVTAIPCDFAATVGLQCLRRNGGWSEIQQLDTPVVLELWDERSAPYYGALTQVDNNQYQLRIGDRTINVIPQDLRDTWFGTYVLLWRTPPGYTGSLRQGDNHETVRWLREQLARIDNQSSSRRTDFDLALRNRVMQFQRDEGLLADGVVGPLTWIRLQARLARQDPNIQNPTLSG